MHELRQYPSLPIAWSAAAYLRSEGILARAYEREGGRLRLGYFAGPLVRVEVWVSIAFEVDREAALALLDEFDTMPAPREADWSAQAEPDLTRLPGDLVIPCEWCKHDLRDRINASWRPGQRVACAGCGRENDPVERVVARHGPEALLGCYPDPADPDWIDPETLGMLRIPCQRCGYPLAGLAPTGHCPECGRDYDKRAIVERSFLDIRM